MLRIGVLVSGGGSNLQAIINKIENGYLENCVVVTVVSSRHGVYALERALNHNIPAICIARRDYGTVAEYDNALLRHFEDNRVDLVVMAGFLSIVGENFVRRFDGRIINVHPSLIPAFCGKGYYGIIPHQKAIEYGVKVTGATVHFVELKADAGPIILQKAVAVKEEDTPETLQKRVMEEAEWEILPLAIKLYADGKLHIDGRKVTVSPIDKANNQESILLDNNNRR